MTVAPSFVAALALLAVAMLGACKPAAAPVEPAPPQATAPPAIAVPATSPDPAAAVAGVARVAPELAARLTAELDAHGASSVAKRLVVDDTGLSRIVDATASGDPVWLALAQRLRAASDAGVSESLAIGIARALPKAPAAVLAMIGPDLPLDTVCTSPFIEPGPGIAEGYAKDATAALATVDDPKLRALATECAAGVELP